MNDYYVDSKVTTWIREKFEAESDEEAIRLVKDGEYDVLDTEYLTDCTEWERDRDDEFICELYKNDDSIIYSNYDY